MQEASKLDLLIVNPAITRVIVLSQFPLGYVHFLYFEMIYYRVCRKIKLIVIHGLSDFSQFILEFIPNSASDLKYHTKY